MMRMLGPGGGGGSSGADPGLLGRVRGDGGALEAAALPSVLACWGLGAGWPHFFRARFGGTGGGRTWGA